MLQYRSTPYEGVDRKERTVSDQASPTRFIRLPEVLRRVPLSRTSIYELMDAGRFPRNVMLSKRASAWTEASITEWCAERLAQSRKGTA
jgi:prophage regulatory protein